jgi:hypothetical protein
MRPASAGRIPEGSSLRSDETSISHASDNATGWRNDSTQLLRSRFDLDRVLARRQCSLELDELLGIPSRPDLVVTYRLTAGVSS